MRPNLIRMAYVTTDLDPALDYWVEVADAGPFYVADYEPKQQVYRGLPYRYPLPRSLRLLG
jgi:hypothetical protein